MALEYATKVLEDELRMISKLLRSSGWEKHPEAQKRQKNKAEQLTEALKTLESVNNK